MYISSQVVHKSSNQTHIKFGARDFVNSYQVLLFVMIVCMWIQLKSHMGVSIRPLLNVRRLCLLTHCVGVFDKNDEKEERTNIQNNYKGTH